MLGGMGNAPPPPTPLYPYIGLRVQNLLARYLTSLSPNFLISKMREREDVNCQKAISIATTTHNKIILTTLMTPS